MKLYITSYLTSVYTLVDNKLYTLIDNNFIYTYRYEVIYTS